MKLNIHLLFIFLNLFSKKQSVWMWLSLRLSNKQSNFLPEQLYQLTFIIALQEGIFTFSNFISEKMLPLFYFIFFMTTELSTFLSFVDCPFEFLLHTFAFSRSLPHLLLGCLSLSYLYVINLYKLRIVNAWRSVLHIPLSIFNFCFTFIIFLV